MRTLTDAHKAALAAPLYGVETRVYVEDGDGYFRPLHALEGYDWVDSVEYSGDIDVPVSRMIIRLFRNVYQMSVAPFMQGSKLNLDGTGAYAPLLDLNRRVIVETITGPVGAQSAVGTWLGFDDEAWNDQDEDTWNDVAGENPPEQVFYGAVEDIEWGGERVELFVDQVHEATARDAFIEDEKTYGDDDGSVLAEDVIQSILTDSGTGITLYTPQPSTFAIRKYLQRKEPALHATRNVALQRAWDLRAKWREATGSFEYTFYGPDRSKSVPDYTFGPSVYMTPQRLGISKTGIRNVVRVVFTDSDTRKRATVVALDTQSILKYGRRFMEVAEPFTKQTSTVVNGSRLAEGIRDDLKEPKANMEIPVHYFFAAELGDLYRFEANTDHFDSDQDLAVIGFRHVLRGSLARGEDRTYLIVRGSPAGAYKEWLKREARPGVARPAPFDGITSPWLNGREGRAFNGDVVDGLNLAIVDNFYTFDLRSEIWSETEMNGTVTHSDETHVLQLMTHAGDESSEATVYSRIGFGLEDVEYSMAWRARVDEWHTRADVYMGVRPIPGGYIVPLIFTSVEVVFGSQPNTIAFSTPNSGGDPGFTDAIPVDPAEWHVYRIEWRRNPDRVMLYVDDILRATHTDGVYGKGMAPLFKVASSKSIFDPNDKPIDSLLEIDWVKMWHDGDLES